MNNVKQISIQSIAGGMYQVLPAVGADGKNILKLIPVQKADGKYVRTVTNLASSYKQAVVEPARVVTPTKLRFTTTNISQSQLPVLHQTSPINYIVKSPSNGPVVQNQTGRRPVEGNGTLPSTSSSVQVSPVPVLPRQNQNLVLVPTGVVNSQGTFSIHNPKHLPITLKSSVFPNGHLLQIPVNAKVKTVPASALPPAIQQKIRAASVTSGSGTPDPKTNLQTVLYVTPVNTVRMVTTNPTVHPSPTAESQNPNPESAQQSVNDTPVKGPSEPSRISSSNSQTQEKPIKWVVEECPDSPAPCIVPINKSSKNSMATNILKTLTTVEKTGENTAPPPAVSQETHSQISSGKDNALVMCNGKVFFLAKKSPELITPPVQKQDVNEAAQRINTETLQSTNCVEHADSEVTSTQNQHSATSRAGVTGITRRDDATPIIIRDDADDLGSEVQEVGYSKPDVIFVSYIKPKKVAVANVEGGSVSEVLTIKDDDEPEKSSTGPVQRFSVDVLQDKSHQCESDSQLRKRFEITSDVRIRLEKIQPQMLTTTSTQTISSDASTSRCPLERIRKLIQESNVVIRTKKNTTATVEVKVDEGKPAPQKRKSESSSPSSKKSRGETPERNSETDCSAPRQITPTPEPPSLSLPAANPSTCMMETEEAVPSCSNTLGTVSQELCSPAAWQQHVVKAAGTSVDEQSLVVAPVEFDEVVRDEKIKRLKDMLKQQEAAVELIRSKRHVP
ncbi:ligand-dependent nuclear receptor-interacting factor 1-like [Polyodon spathula]|uniref:ligand-dependent nuclear receptor-interacting factor 1-like n=1 Tax=Polyodon spathula TaxID=7913 RepID=UPI001B7DCD60|nr:ligand-dependent nuclear receptor-interacting factor 1-like [Polyodon spathula]XP_041083107.1 ligand-dependent nuclear receptor-interacting factor 1-like [Polyodon spathula]